MWSFVSWVAPPNVVTPAALAETAAEPSQLRPGAHRAGEGRLRSLRHGGLSAWPRSIHPKLIHLIYRPEGEESAARPGGQRPHLRFRRLQPLVGAAQIDDEVDGGSAGAGAALHAERRAGVEVHMIVALRKHDQRPAVHPATSPLPTAPRSRSPTPTPCRLGPYDALLYACEQKPDAVLALPPSPAPALSPSVMS